MFEKKQKETKESFKPKNLTCEITEEILWCVKIICSKWEKLKLENGTLFFDIDGVKTPPSREALLLIALVNGIWGIRNGTSFKDVCNVLQKNLEYVSTVTKTNT